MTEVTSIHVSSILLGITVLISVIMLASHHVAAQTLEGILQERNAFKNNPQLKLGDTSLKYMAVNSELNKVYVADEHFTVFVIDSNTGNITKKIRVGLNPTDIAIDTNGYKVYVANKGDNTVSVIDGLNDIKEADVHVGKEPVSIAIGANKVYVLNQASGSVSVINGTTNKVQDVIHVDTKMQCKCIRLVDSSPDAIAVHHGMGEDKIYVANTLDDTVSIINGTSDKVEATVPVGQSPIHIAIEPYFPTDQASVYVVNQGDPLQIHSGTVSVINGTTCFVARLTILCVILI